MIKGLLLDYGGTIDTNGLHWAIVLKNSYAKLGVAVPEDLFAKAYAFGERGLAINPLVRPSHTFLEVLQLKLGQQFNFLESNGCPVDHDKASLIALDCNDFVREIIKKSIPILEELARDFPMVIVSNFYGNLETVLQDFGIRKYFAHVVESAVVGVRKPDPAIYQIGIDLLELSASECMVVGDSFTKDIVPAKQLGCTAVWLNVKGWEEDKATGEYQADVEIDDFSDLIKVTQSTKF